MPTPKKLPASGTGVLLKTDNLAQLIADMKLLAGTEVLVGFPEDTTDRDDGSPLTNAARGYIHDNGAPEQNIPARPFMLPGMKDAEIEVTRRLARTAQSVLKNSQKDTPKKDIVEKGLHRVGAAARDAIKAKISEGIPPPLADSTLQARARKYPSRKGEKAELLVRSWGVAPSTEFAKPLIDTGEMQNSVNYVIRSKTDRKE